MFFGNYNVRAWAWIQLAQDRANMVTKLRVPYEWGISSSAEILNPRRRVNTSETDLWKRQDGDHAIRHCCSSDTPPGCRTNG